MTEVLDVAKRLIAAPSVTPATGAVFDAMEAMLAPLGFEVARFKRGEGEEGSPEAPVENLFAIRRGPPGSKHELGARRGAAVGERIVGCVSGDPRVGERAQGGEQLGRRARPDCGGSVASRQ